MALTSVSEYKAYRGITVTTWDSQFTVFLGVAHAMVRRLAGRDTEDGFEEKERTETYDGTGTEYLQLTEWPVSEIGSVALVADDDSETALTAATDYRVNGKSGVLTRKGAVTGRFAGGFRGDGISCVIEPMWGTHPQWPLGTENISVTYTGGYNPVPEDLKAVVWVAMDMQAATAGLGGSGGLASGMKSEGIGDYNYVRMTPEEKDSLLLKLLAPFMPGGV